MIIGIVENDSEYRKHLERNLQEFASSGEIHSWESAEVCWRELNSCNPEILLLDVGLPGMDGIEFAEILSREKPDIKKIILTSLDTDEKIFRAMKAGCLGYALKSEMNDIKSVIQVVQEGGAVISPMIALRVMQQFQASSSTREDRKKLTNQESNVLAELVRGQSPRQVAGVLQISIHTVRQHIKSIYQKLHVNNRTGLIRKAIDMGF